MQLEDQNDDIQEDVEETTTEKDLEAQESEADDVESDDENESEESETTEKDDAEESESDDEEIAAKPKKNGFKKRIDRYKRKVSRANEETEYWKAQALKVKDDSEKPADNPDVEANGMPSNEDFDSYEEYMRALTRWEVKAAFNARKESQEKKKAESAKEAQAQTWQKRMTVFTEKTPDFEEVMDDADDVEMTGVMSEAILDSELGPEVLYHLAKNPDEVERIKGLSDLGAIREIGKIEAQVSPVKKAKKKTTKAPKPLSKTKGGAKFSKDLSDKSLSFKEYEAMRNKQHGRAY